MNRRTLLGGLFACLAASGCGGRAAVVTFAPANQDLAKSLAASVGKKDMEGVRRAQRAADNRDASKMLNDEKEAFKYVVSLCEKNEWDKAREYIDKCLVSGK